MSRRRLAGGGPSGHSCGKGGADWFSGGGGGSDFDNYLDVLRGHRRTCSMDGPFCPIQLRTALATSPMTLQMDSSYLLYQKYWT